MLAGLSVGLNVDGLVCVTRGKWRRRFPLATGQSGGLAPGQSGLSTHGQGVSACLRNEDMCLQNEDTRTPSSGCTVARARTEPVSPLETSPQPDPLFGRRAEPAGRTGLCLSAWLLPQPQLADQPTRAPRVDSSARAYPCPRALDSVRSGAFQPNPSVCAQPLTILTRGLLPMRSPSAENRVVALTRRPQFRTRGLGFQRRAHRPVGERSIAPDRNRITRPGISCGTRANLTRMGSFLPDTSDLSRSDSLALRPRGSLRRMLTSVMDHIPSSLPVVLCSHTFELIPHRLPLLSAPLFTFT